MFRITHRLLLAGAIASLLPLAASHAQRAKADNGTSVRVAMVDTLPLATASAMIIRKGNDVPLIVIDQNHNDDNTLGMALALLRRIRAEPVAPGEQQIIPIQGGVATGKISAERRAFVKAQLKALNASRVTKLGNLGHGRIVEFNDAIVSTSNLRRS